MPCLNPLTAYKSKIQNLSGKYSMRFTASETQQNSTVKIPCGKCIFCRLEKSRQWAIRAVHEAQLYDYNSFLTLTYSDECLPVTLTGLPSLYKRDMVLFIKKLRKDVHQNAHKYYFTNGTGIRYLQCGEYGEKLLRPHHHMALFNCDFADKKLWTNRGNVALYTSEILNSLWNHGYCIIGSLNWESAAYIARYTVKKITGNSATDHYAGRVPEYATMSRRPGLGKKWIDKYGSSDVFRHDRIIIRDNLQVRPPKYYDKILENLDENRYIDIKEKRKEASISYPVKRKNVLTKAEIINHNKQKRSYEES